MSLAARLNRLRSGATSAASNAPSAAVSANGESPRRSADSTALSAALQGELVADGLLLSDMQQAVTPDGTGIPQADDLPETCGLANPDWVYLDTETTGLSGGTGNLAFMVGLARYGASGQLCLKQYTLASFAGERALLAELDKWITDDSILVSYNGRCFDVPLLSGRLRLHRLADRLAERPHLDLMFTVRRAYRAVWPDCRLQTAERRRLNLQRVDDLPGAEAPHAWQAWLRTGRIDGLARVLMHNRQDVLSLARLHRVLALDYKDPADQSDIRRIGNAWQAAGQHARALRLWQRHRARLGEPGLLALADALRRAGDWPEAEGIWLRLHREGSGAAACALSKYYEHRQRDYHRALKFALGSDEKDCQRRVDRLRRKLGGWLGPSNLELPFYHRAVTGISRPQRPPSR